MKHRFRDMRPHLPGYVSTNPNMMSLRPIALRRVALACVAAAACLSTAHAADSPSVQQQLTELQQAVAAQKAQLEAQQKLLEQQAALIEKLQKQADEQAQGRAADAATVAKASDAKPKPNDAKPSDAPKVSMNNGRPTITSADGRSSASLRGVVQFDMASYQDGTQGPLATDYRRGSVGATGNRETNAASDFSDGAYFRRARMGFEGTFTRDFEYRLMLELGGAGTEGPTRINDAWIAYTGLGPFRIQLGAFSPAANMEDSTSVDDQLFIERATPSELSRTLAAADGRLGLAVRGAGKRWMSSLTLTSRTANDAEVFDSQLATVGRAGFLVATTDNYNVHLGVNGTYVFQPADQGNTVASRYPIRFRDRPEVRVDSTRLIDTGGIDASSAYAAGLEFAMNWKNFLLQGEDFRYGVERRDPTTLANPKFGGYYVEGSWVITGERHRYTMTNAAFQPPRPRAPYGAWELALRYSHTDLDFHEGVDGTAASPDSIRGGVQNIKALGVNWYPNTNFRLMLEYLMISANRLNPAGPGNLQPFGPAPGTPPIGAQIGQDLDVIALRSQFAF
jgi:phosphate-selective porin OprO and OprP